MNFPRAERAGLYRFLVQLLVVSAFATLLVTSSRGSEIAMDFTGNGGTLFQANATFGWSFTVHQPIRVDRLGFFDDYIAGGMGLRLDHQVRLWRDDGSEALLAATVVTDSSVAAPSTAEDGEWRYEAIDPIVLRRGNYVIGADDPGCGAATCDRIRYITDSQTMPAISHGRVRNAGTPGFPHATTFDREDGYFGPSFWATPLPGPDFNQDDRANCQDIDALVAEIDTRNHSVAFDMTGDGFVDHDDLEEWLYQAGSLNLGPDRPYLVGDANLDGDVDGQDFVTWNAHKFTPTAAWCDGDFNASGEVDGQDFVLWNSHKFTSARAHVATVPEPGARSVLLMLVGMVAVAGRRLR